MTIISNQSDSLADAHGEVSEPVSLRGVDVIAIHGGLYSRFTKHNCIESFMSYTKARELCSQEDLALNEAISEMINQAFDSWIVSTPGYNYKYFDSAFRTAMSPDEQREYNQILNHVAKLPHVQEAAEAYLNPKAYDAKHGIERMETELCLHGLGSSEEANATYRVVAYQSSIYIVVEEGFLEQMEDKTSKLAFISEVLKAAYAVMPINSVNQSQWYSIYLDALRASSPQ